jgi:hypothetical protein
VISKGKSQESLPSLRDLNPRKCNPSIGLMVSNSVPHNLSYSGDANNNKGFLRASSAFERNARSLSGKLPRQAILAHQKDRRGFSAR